MKSILYQKYQTESVPALKEKFGYKNINAVPKIEKVSVNIGINARNTESNYVDNVESIVTRITGQKPVKTKAKKAISAFKIREGMVVGVKATLRGQMMYDFLDKLVLVAVPRIRDFRGLDIKNIDNTGNLTLGLKEYNVFPEILPDEVERNYGLEISITTSAKNYEEGLELFKTLGFPFKKQ
ncbi:50S ribosomal protein L5 [Candidatus Falkowbacteria bacterium]|uniref:Large ribosomal subunit protein uL5 n=1 Tax=Candidatus Buchananbacteria bacterium CG10_big_fil_rev_8_21_14_0_10_33_19 TaxID=1974525 RepID=A0A2H0W312_9BACT|nr:50S ribosomal protein L5 [Candidatus Falkowbacteria bacterium]PIS05736.1 MAG: 50S ribosomal protein L5 [Candidatus Buchananbacteria bacterium CG10_big_fil_rev_8_21_14_0_10_33_19]